MAWEDEITPGQISYIENLAIDLEIWNDREKWFMDLVKKRCLSDFNRRDASTVIDRFKMMKIDQGLKKKNLVFNFEEGTDEGTVTFYGETLDET